jgi:phage terminase large subunit GpA-like protein
LESKIFDDRLENYGIEPIPEQVCLITIGADVQKDRIELEYVGWGEGEESWGLGYEILYGDTEADPIWTKLTDAVSKTFLHPSGMEFAVAYGLVDMGHKADRVLAFCKKMISFGKDIYPCKGKGNTGGNQPPIVPYRPSLNNELRIPHWNVGTNATKSLIYDRIPITLGLPRSMHFDPKLGYDEEYFTQLTAEKIVTRYSYGKPYRLFEKPHSSTRNEALDVRVYATAAIKKLRPNFEKIADEISKYAEKKKEEIKAPEQTTPKRKRISAIGKKKNWVNNWK